MRPLAILTIAFAAFGPSLAAAQTTTVRTDTLLRIVAVVGDSIITNDELEQAIDFWASTNQQLPPPPGPELDALIEEILNGRIETLLLVQAAQRDTTIDITDEAIRTAVDTEVANAQARYPSRAEFERALAAANLTLQEYRSMLSAQIRQSRLVSEYMGRQMRDRKPPPISDSEIRAAFDQQVEAAGGPPMMPPSITFEQVVVPVTPSDSALAAARAMTDSILTLVRVEGQDFAALARRFSEDPGSKDVGGDLGWFRPGQMFAAFERAAYNPLLKPGDVSEPVLTPAGYHIILLQRVRGPERRASHILIRPLLDDADRERARAIADSIAVALKAGVAIDSLRRAWGDRDEPPRLGPVERDSMPAEYRAALADVSAGQVVGPFGYGVDGPIPKWAVVHVERVEPARPATVEDYRARLQQILGQSRLEQEILAELRRSTYIEIRRSTTASRN